MRKKKTRKEKKNVFEMLLYIDLNNVTYIESKTLQLCIIVKTDQNVTKVCGPFSIKS